MAKYSYLFTKEQQEEATRLDKESTPNVDPKKDYWRSLYTKEWKESPYNDNPSKATANEQFQINPYGYGETTWLSNNEPVLASDVEEKIQTKEFQRYLASEQKEEWLDIKINKWNNIIWAEKQEIENRKIQINYIKEGRLYPPRNILTRTFPILNVKAVWHRRKLERVNFQQNKIIKKQEAIAQKFREIKTDIKQKNSLYESNNIYFFNELNRAHKAFQKHVKAQNAQAPAPAPQPQVAASSAPVQTSQAPQTQTPALTVNFS